MKSVSVCTLGCKVNQYESEAMLTLFKENGYEIKDFNDLCDVYVINTCVVTAEGERKSRQMIKRAIKKNASAVVAVVGCYSQIKPEKVKEIDGVSVVIGTKDRHDIVSMVESALKEKLQKSNVTDILKVREFENLEISGYEDKTRAFVKIEEGCTEFCSYCIIPYARGPVRSRSLESIKNEVETLARNGYKEIVLTGIHIGSYGKDLKDLSLLDAVKTVCSVDGIERVRLGSVEPRTLTDEFVNEIKNLGKVCDHFHISLQSGCDATLKRMNRKYTSKEYEDAVSRLRSAFDNPAITTDIITGFPGETEDDFNESFEFMKKMKFSEVHVFPYSQREGTKAALFENQVDKGIREKRAKIMIEYADKMHEEYVSSFEGKKADVLFERKSADGNFEGHMTNYIRVRAKSDIDISNKIISVTLSKAENGIIDAKIN